MYWKRGILPPQETESVNSVFLGGSHGKADSMTKEHWTMSQQT